ncbi:MAG: hypothetical protein Q4G25_11830 [Paracoccus sp. (in: a-proteobacteria)]|nr:hypothetical protein [Paracoccus sp. (in: a-proteobacteria)]
MRPGLAFVAVIMLVAACGVDGAPERPDPPGVTVSGDARIGVRVNDL